MSIKLLIFISTCVCFLVHGSEVESRVAASNDAESYITLEAAKELRNKLGLRKQHVEHQQDDYDEILKEIIRHLPKQQQPQQQQQQTEIFFEKKYFDYLPNEISDSDDITSEELSQGEYVSSEEQQHVPHNEQRMKRELSVQQAERNKRQSAESRSDFGQAIPPNPNYNNPWTPQNMPNMKFHAPNNFYLPPATPSPTYLPVAPTYKPPINVPQPPDNKVGNEDENGPDDRISLFAGEDKYIIDSRPIYTNQQSSNSNRKPTPPVIKPSEQPNRPNTYPIVPPNEKNTEDLDIEFAPELQEDLSTTTRAPIKIPDRKNRKQQNNNNRQKKSATLPLLENLRDRFVTGPPLFLPNLQQIGRKINFGRFPQSSENQQEQQFHKNFSEQIAGPEVTVATSIDLKKPETIKEPKSEKKEETEIEYAPELQEDWSTTTRASIVIPTRTLNKS